MIVTLKTTLVRGRYCEADWSANIEIDESATLEDLHYAIQKAVDFENDHLYCLLLVEDGQEPESRILRRRKRVDLHQNAQGLVSLTDKAKFVLPLRLGG